MWAAEQLTRGRVFVQAVSASLVDGVSGGAAMAASAYSPTGRRCRSVASSRQSRASSNVVDASFGSMIGETLSASAFIVLGVAFVVEVCDRFRVNPIVSTIVVAIAAGIIAANDQERMLPALVLIAGMALAARHRRDALSPSRIPGGWIAGMASGWLTTAWRCGRWRIRIWRALSQRARGDGGGNCRGRRVGRRPQAVAEIAGATSGRGARCRSRLGRDPPSPTSTPPPIDNGWLARRVTALSVVETPARQRSRAPCARPAGRAARPRIQSACCSRFPSRPGERSPRSAPSCRQCRG